MRFPRWRKMTWLLLVVNALFIWWVIAGTSSAQNDDCAPGDSLCEAAVDAGTGIGVALIVILWFFVFIVLALIWMMTRPRGRTCPACGEDVKKGLTACPKCQHDFAAAAVTPAVTP